MNQRRTFGIIIVLIGGLFLLNSLDIGFDLWDIIGTWWPVVIIAIGALNLIGNGGIRMSGVLIIGVGVYFLLDQLNLIRFDFSDILFPAIVIGVGVFMLMPKAGKQPVGNDYIRQMALFSGADIHCNSQDFKGADLMAVFGGLDVDLRDVTVFDRPARIDVFTAFGGLDIIVPEDHTVKIKGLPLFGGWSNKANKSIASEEADIIVNAFVIFGGMEVKAKPSTMPTESYEDEYEGESDGYKEV